MKTKTSDQVIRDIAEALAECSGEIIEDIANMVLNVHVRYKGDSLFEECESDYNIGDEVEVESIDGNPPFNGTVIGFRNDNDKIIVRDVKDNILTVNIINVRYFVKKVEV